MEMKHVKLLAQIHLAGKAHDTKNKSQADTSPAPEDQKLTLSPGNTLKFQGKEGLVGEETASRYSTPAP